MEKYQEEESNVSEDSLDTETIDTILKPEEKKEGISLELGDLIEIISPTNPELNEQTFYIAYIDETRIEIINVASYSFSVLSLDDDGTLSDESITQILLLDRSEEKGYARQNKLGMDTWVDIHFNGDIPIVVTCTVTDIEEDKVEFTSYPENEIFYIDFEYKGLPKDIPIEKIIIRDPPAAAIYQPVDLREISPVAEGEGASITWTETGESVIQIPDGSVPDENIRDVLKKIYIDANELFGQDLGVVFRKTEVKEEHNAFYATSDEKFNDLIDELLVNIPGAKRRGVILQKIHRLVERFKELRQLYSEYNENGVIIGKRIVDYGYKPLVDRLLTLDANLKWILPVVNIRKKLYLSPKDFENKELVDMFSERSDIYLTETDLNDIVHIEEEYTKNMYTGDNNKYLQYCQKILENTAPFNAPIENTQLLDFEKSVRSDLEAIVSNYGDYMSDSIGNDKIEKIGSVKYYIQKYNLDMKNVKSIEMKNGKRVYMKEPLFPADKLTLKHLIMMPNPVVRYSRIHLPSTDILSKTQMANTPLYMHKIFNERFKIPIHTVSDLEKELDYEEMEEKGEFRFLSKPTAFILDDDLLETRDKFEKYLNVIVPKVRVLVRILKKYINDKISIVDVLKYLEPFLIYPEDLTYGQFKEIRYFIKEKIAEIRGKMSKQSEEYSKLYKTIYPHREISSKNVNPIKSIFYENKNIQDNFFKYYLSNTETENINDRKWTSSEDMLKVLDTDNAQLFSNMMTFMLLSLVTPNKLLDGNEKAELDVMDNESVGKKDCVRRFLSKKYNSIGELQKDNNKEEVYYDKIYDDTKYDILKKYENERKTMLPDKFRDYLAETLVQKHDCPRDVSEDMAETIIAGKRRVKDGEYAMVEMKPDIADFELKRRKKQNDLTEKEQEELEIEEKSRTKLYYYKRMRGTWVRDESISDESFYDNNTLFCNVDASCLKNQKNNVCEPIEHAALRSKKDAAESALKEFDRRFTVTMNELKTSIEKFIYSREKSIVKNKEISYRKLYKGNFIQFKLGEMVTKSEKIESPHTALFNLIMSQDDFTKKQEDICRFISTFCRESLEETAEDPHWYYCNDTNTKLVPISIGRLATAFVSDEEDYSLFLDKICHEYGRLSEDGDSIVDMYSGYVLRKIDFVDQDEYDENTGFKMNTHAILEKDTTTVVQEMLGEKKKLQVIYDDELTQTIYNVLATLCNNADIPVDEIGEFVIGFSTQMMRNSDIVLTEKKYKKRVEKSDKEMPPYSVYYNQTLIVIVACLFHIAIQTSIPSLKPKKTFTGCVRSFSGYPMEGVEDTTGLKYTACVMKGSSSSIEPWNAIRKLNVDNLVKRMKDVLDRYILTDIQITNLYIKKREYIQLNPEMVIVEEHGIKKWRHFLPPLVEYSIEKKANGVGEGFHTETKDLIEKGSDKQRSHFSVYKTNILRNTFSVIEMINRVISKKESILRTANQVPYLESACCNEPNKSIYPLEYFAEEDTSILLDLKRCQSSQIMLDRIRELTLPPTFFHNESTRFAYPKLPEGVVSSNIYKAYIHYCNFDSDLPIPADLETVCREKPEYYEPNVPIEEKINALVTHGKKYDKASLDALMSNVYRRNQLPSVNSPVYLPINVFKDIIEHLHNTASSVIPESLRNLLLNVLEHYDSNVLVYDGDTLKTPFQKAMHRLRNYLTISNTELHKNVMAYIDKYGNLEKTEYTNIENFMLGLCQWKMDQDIKKTGTSHDDGLYRVTQFVENAIYYMTRSIPSIIIHDRNIPKTKIPEHWKFSKIHEQDIRNIVNSTFEELRHLQGDDVIKQFLMNIDIWGAEIFRFIRNIPVHTSIVKEGLSYNSLFDKRTVYMLYHFVWYSTLYEFIETSDDDELLKVDIQTMRNEIRNENKEKTDRNLDIDVEFERLDESVNETEYELQEVQIVSGIKSKLKEKVCGLLIAYIRLHMKEKKVLDIVYEDMMKRVNTTKQNEKKSITDFFQGLNKDERKIENMFKQYKLERWNVGNQKGVYKYDKSIYDNEHELNIKRALEDEMLAEIHIEDLDGNGFVNLQGNAMDVDEFEDMQNREAAQFYEDEAMDMGGLRDGFMDGVYYEEDGTDDFGYDD